MTFVWIAALASVFLVSLISFVGVLTLSFQRDMLERILSYLVAFAAGTLLGDAFIHLLPEAVAETGFTLSISLYILLGLVISFIVEKAVHWQHRHEGLLVEEDVEPFAVMNLFGDAVHNFVDGLIIGVSYVVSIPVGVATTLAVIFHEIPQEMGDFGVLLHGGMQTRRALFFNFLIALTSVIGTVTALILTQMVGGLEIALTAFAGGTFIYISAATLIPEIHRTTDVRVSAGQLISLLLGIGMMLLLTL